MTEPKTIDDLLRAYDALPLREGRYADLMIETTEGRVAIRDLVIDRDGTVLIVPLVPLGGARQAIAAVSGRTA